MEVVNAVTGANAPNAHLVNVNPGRDFQPETVADLRMVTEGDRCPNCRGPLAFIQAIEVGHVFKLGTKYSEALGAVFQDEQLALKPMIMGCYGIGINRLIAAAVEQGHDAQGIVWPAALSPFQVLVSVLDPSSAEHLRVGVEAHDALVGAGFDVLLDERERSPGSKLKDGDLVGIPVRVVIGKVWQNEQHLEVSRRARQDKARVKPQFLVEAVRKLLDNSSAS